ncbi:acyl-CoA thioesterase [Sphingosinicella rhizophila]|uniref:Thioesterase family protein n=1 Tax=Sphingosinicella rhizophila TaxID=3050082 RepID=A0ABU3QAD6_9SPHN|nr:thioesterase family protein [Sphingosinicella sp. GR2756]MDT9600353.1 thioesterase family protein [Sphingosinicella sp. GR2756]
MPSDLERGDGKSCLFETHRGIVYPGDGDVMGHLPTFRYLQMFEAASYHLLAQLGFDFAAAGKVGFADRRHEIDYLVEVRAGSLLLIRSGVLAVGRSSLRTVHVMTDVARTKEHARLEMLSICFDLQIRKSMPLPQDLRHRAELLQSEAQA